MILIFGLKSELPYWLKLIELVFYVGGTGFEYANLAYDESNSNSSLEEVFLSFPPEDKSQQADLTKWETLTKLDKGTSSSSRVRIPIQILDGLTLLDPDLGVKW